MFYIISFSPYSVNRRTQYQFTKNSLQPPSLPCFYSSFHNIIPSKRTVLYLTLFQIHSPYPSAKATLKKQKIPPFNTAPTENTKYISHKPPFEQSISCG